jgi:hypothetical protein
LSAAVRALAPDCGDDLRGLRVAALAFKLVVRGRYPLAVAHAVDDEGAEHWLAIRSASAVVGVEVAYGEILTDLLRRGLSTTRPLIVDADGCVELARKLELVFGPVLHAGRAREAGGHGLVW